MNRFHFTCAFLLILVAVVLHAWSMAVKLPGDFQYVRCVNKWGNPVPGGKFTNGDTSTFVGVCPRLWIAGGKFVDDVTLLCSSASNSLYVRLESVVDDDGTTSTTIVWLTLTNVGRIEGDVRGADDRWESRNAKGGTCTGTDWPKMHIDGGSGNDVLQSGSNNDTLFGNHGIDVLIARDGDDVVWAGSGQTYADGGDGKDYVRGAGDNDFIFGGLDRDTVVAYGQSDLVSGDGSALGKFDGVQILGMLVSLNVTSIAYDTSMLNTFVCDDLTGDRILLRKTQGAGLDIIVRGACSTPGTLECALDGFDLMAGAPQSGDLVFNGTFTDCATLFASKLTPAPTTSPTQQPTDAPTQQPTDAPSVSPTAQPTNAPTTTPTQQPTNAPTQPPTGAPSVSPTAQPTNAPTTTPTQQPTQPPTNAPTQQPTNAPTQQPTNAPTQHPTQQPTQQPTNAPTKQPTMQPTNAPTKQPIVIGAGIISWGGSGVSPDMPLHDFDMVGNNVGDLFTTPQPVGTGFRQWTADYAGDYGFFVVESGSYRRIYRYQFSTTIVTIMLDLPNANNNLEVIDAEGGYVVYDHLIGSVMYLCRATYTDFSSPACVPLSTYGATSVRDVDIDSVGNRVFVALTTTNNIMEITLSSLTTFSVVRSGRFANGLKYDRVNGRLWYGYQDGNNVCYVSNPGVSNSPEACLGTPQVGGVNLPAFTNYDFAALTSPQKHVICYSSGRILTCDVALSGAPQCTEIVAAGTATGTLEYCTFWLDS